MGKVGTTRRAAIIADSNRHVISTASACIKISQMHAKYLLSLLNLVLADSGAGVPV